MHFKIPIAWRVYFLILLFLLYSSAGLADERPALQARSKPIHSQEFSIKGNEPTEAPRIAIIIDDLGMSLPMAQAFLDIEVAISFSILPGLAYSREVAELAHSRKRDVLCHIPMEPYKYPSVSAGSYSLLTSMGPANLKKTLIADLASVPYITGANNHMGSKLTEDEKIMRLVLGHLKSLNLFFIDSVTTPNSKAYHLAREMGLKTAKRDVFLDSDRDPASVKKQFRKLKMNALANGSSIGIGHPNPTTLSVLQEMIPEFEASGIRFVPVAELAW